MANVKAELAEEKLRFNALSRELKESGPVYVQLLRVRGALMSSVPRRFADSTSMSTRERGRERDDNNLIMYK